MTYAYDDKPQFACLWLAVAENSVLQAEDAADVALHAFTRFEADRTPCAKDRTSVAETWVDTTSSLSMANETAHSSWVH